MIGEAVFIQYFFPATNKRKLCGVLHEQWEFTDSNSTSCGSKRISCFFKDLSWHSRMCPGGWNQQGPSLSVCQWLVLSQAAFGICPFLLLVSLTGQSQTHQLKCCSSICTPWRALLCQHSVTCSWEKISGYLLIKPRVSDPSKIYMWLSKVSMLLTGYI